MMKKKAKKLGVMYSPNVIFDVGGQSQHLRSLGKPKGKKQRIIKEL
jgi:hypothetical protein